MVVGTQVVIAMTDGETTGELPSGSAELLPGLPGPAGIEGEGAAEVLGAAGAVPVGTEPLLGGITAGVDGRAAAEELLPGNGTIVAVLGEATGVDEAMGSTELLATGVVGTTGVVG